MAALIQIVNEEVDEIFQKSNCERQGMRISFPLMSSNINIIHHTTYDISYRIYLYEAKAKHGLKEVLI